MTQLDERALNLLLADVYEQLKSHLQMLLTVQTSVTALLGALKGKDPGFDQRYQIAHMDATLNAYAVEADRVIDLYEQKVQELKRIAMQP